MRNFVHDLWLAMTTNHTIPDFLIEKIYISSLILTEKH
jgi:hypothetical protein